MCEHVRQLSLENEYKYLTYKEHQERVELLARGLAKTHDFEVKRLLMFANTSQVMVTPFVSSTSTVATRK